MGKLVQALIRQTAGALGYEVTAKWRLPESPWPTCWLPSTPAIALPG